MVCHERRVFSKITRARNTHEISFSQKWTSEIKVDLKLLSTLLKKVTARRQGQGYNTSLHEIERREIGDEERPGGMS